MNCYTHTNRAAAGICATCQKAICHDWVALGLGLSVGGFAVGSVAIGGLAIGFRYAIGGAAFGSSVLDSRRGIV